MTDQYDEEDKPICGCCDEELLNEGFGNMVNMGCCSDGRCAHEPQIEALCGDCGTWDEEDEVWRCPDCQEQHEAEKHNDDPPSCEKCKQPCWSNNDCWQMIDGCAVCQDCFDENEAKVEWEKREKCPCGLTLSDDDMALEKVHDVRLCEGCFEENKKAHEDRVVPRFNFSYSDGDVRGCDIYGQWWVRVKSDKWDWDYKKEEQPPGKVTLEILLEHVKKLQKEDPKKYEELNAKFQKCA
jgi:hypothetical protein